MPRFFITEEQIDNGTVRLVGEDAHHVARSLRMAVGETITVCDSAGKEYLCRLERFESDAEVLAEVLSCRMSDTEPKCRVTLFQALPKGDKLDTVIQKAVECGASEIVPFESSRCVVRVKDVASEQKKTERRRRIAEAAAKQCGRGILPTVAQTVGFEGMLELASRADLALFCYEGEGTEPLGRVLARELAPSADGKYPSVSVVVGSEGGFSPDEAAAAVRAGLLPIGLGKRILRTETAPVFALSCIACLTELS